MNTCSQSGSGLNNDIRIILQTFYGYFHWHAGSLSIFEYWLVLSFQRCTCDCWPPSPLYKVVRLNISTKSTIHVFVSVRLLKLRVTFLKCICLFDLLFCFSVVIFFFHSLSLSHTHQFFSLLFIIVCQQCHSLSLDIFYFIQNGMSIVVYVLRGRKAKTNTRQLLNRIAFIQE